MPTYQKFSDFAVNENRLPGEKQKVADVINRMIAVTGYRTMPSKCDKDKLCLELQFEYADANGVTDGRKFVVFTSSVVLLKQIEQYKDKIPFLTTIVKQGNYYTFS